MFVDVIDPPQWNKRLIAVAFLLIFGLGMGVLSAIVAFRNPVLSIALVAVIASSALGIWHPRISFFLFLGLLPFVDFLKRLQLTFTVPSSLEWYLVLALPDILLLSTVVGVVFKQAIVKRQLTIKMGRTEWWLLAFLGSMLLGVAHSVFPITVSMAVFKLSGLYILVYFLAPALITERQHLRFLLKMSFVLSLVVALYGLWQTAFGMTSFEEKWLTGGYTGLEVETIIFYTLRPFSTLSGPQAYAYYLAIGLICGLVYIRGFVPPNTRRLWYVGAFLGAVAIGLSLTRSAILLFVLAWLLGRWLPKARLCRRPMMLFFLGSLSIVGSVVLLLRFGDPIQSWALSSGIPVIQRAFVVGTLSDRFRGWYGIATDSRYWTFLGYGLGTTASTVMRKYGLTFDLFTHDEYTGLLVEQGLIGLTLLLGFLLAWMRFVMLRLQTVQSVRLARTGWALMGLSLGLLLVGMLGTFLKVSPINVYFWLIAGLLARSTFFESGDIRLSPGSGDASFSGEEMPMPAKDVLSSR